MVDSTPTANGERLTVTLTPSSQLPTLNGSTISVRVGSGFNSEIFHVHNDLICSSSTFFQNATKPEWSGFDGKPIDLSDEEPKTFQGYLNWLYSREVAIGSTDAETWNALGNAYVIGEKLMDTKFQNVVMGAIITYLQRGSLYPGDSFTRTIYEGTMPLSPARRLVVDFWTWAAQAQWLEKDLSQVSVEFVDDLAKSLIIDRPVPGTTTAMARQEGPWAKAPESYYISANQQSDATK